MNIQLLNGTSKVFPIPYYPIGSVYMSYESTSPASMFGGEWERITDKFLYGSTTSGTTGGEANHTLTISEMPAHTHATRGRNGSGTSVTDGVGESYLFSSTTTGSYNNTGGGGAHNNMPPYLAVYMWKKISNGNNALPTSVDTNGTTIFNGTGYKAGYRWSVSGGGVVEDAAGYCSGIMPIATNCRVYLYNVKMNKNTYDSICGVYLFDNNNLTVPANSSGITTLETYCSPIWDEDGNLVYFTIPYANTTHIALNSSYIGPDSVVTIINP